MLTVLHLLASRDVGGAERVAAQIASGLRGAVLATYASPYGERLARFLAGKGVAYLPLDRMSARAVRRAVRALRPAVLHAHDYRASVLAAMAGSPIRVISHLHSNPPWAGRPGIRSLAYLVAMRRIDRVVLASPSIARDFLAPSRLKSKAIVVPNVVDRFSLYRLAQAAPQSQLDLLFVGRLSEEKNPLEFIRIVAAVRERVPGLRAALIGSGPQEKLVQEEIASQRLEGDVRLLGFQANPYPWMSRAAMLVVPSRFEGFGLAALEAMLFGVPVIAAPTGGLAEMVAASGGGRICHSFAESVKTAIDWLQHPDQRRQIGDAGRRWAEAHCDVGRYLQTFRQLYESLAKPSSGDVLAVA